LENSLTAIAIDGQAIDWVFYSDCDTVFTNFPVPIESFMHPTKSFILSGDGHVGGPDFSINSGHLLLKNTAFSRALLTNVTKMRSLYLADRATWETVVNGWKSISGIDFMHDQSLFDALLGGADPNDPTSWSRSAKNNVGQYATIADCRVSMARLSPWMQRHVELLPSYVFNSNPWTFYPGAFKYHATALDCDGPIQQQEYKLQTLISAMEGNYTNPCRKW
jgi:hypothetical protein